MSWVLKAGHWVMISCAISKTSGLLQSNSKLKCDSRHLSWRQNLQIAGPNYNFPVMRIVLGAVISSLASLLVRFGCTVISIKDLQGFCLFNTNIPPASQNGREPQHAKALDRNRVTLFFFGNDCRFQRDLEFILHRNFKFRWLKDVYPLRILSSVTISMAAGIQVHGPTKFQPETFAPTR